jgi:hypothetical protein
MQLIIGAGKRLKDGWTHHDVQDLPGIDIVCQFWDLPKHVEAGSCSNIEMTHVLEHFPMAETHKVLSLVYDLLEPGGELYLEVPNFEWHAREIISNPLNRQIVEYAFGGQHNEWDFHYNGFTPQILVEDLAQANFDVKDIHPDSSIEAWAGK